jgi:hypothetical protein
MPVLPVPSGGNASQPPSSLGPSGPLWSGSSGLGLRVAGSLTPALPEAHGGAYSLPHSQPLARVPRWLPAGRCPRGLHWLTLTIYMMAFSPLVRCR